MSSNTVGIMQGGSVLSKRQRSIQINSEDSEAGSESERNAIPPRKKRRLVSSADHNGRRHHPSWWKFWGKSNAHQSRGSSDDESEDDPIQLNPSPKWSSSKRNFKGKHIRKELPLSDPRSSIWIGRENFKLAVVVETRGDPGSTVLQSTLLEEKVPFSQDIRAERQSNKGFARLVRPSPERSPEGDPELKMPPKRKSKITDFYSAPPKRQSASRAVSSRINTNLSRDSGSSFGDDHRMTTEPSEQHSEADQTASKTPTSFTSTAPTSFDESSDSTSVTKSGRPSRTAAAVANRKLKHLNSSQDLDNEFDPEDNEEDSNLDIARYTHRKATRKDDEDEDAYEDKPAEESEDENESVVVDTVGDLTDKPAAKRQRLKSEPPSIAVEVSSSAAPQQPTRAKPTGAPKVVLPDPPIDQLQVSQAKAARGSRPKKAPVSEANRRYKVGIDTSLPPLHKLDDIFADMTNNALKHGFKEALKSLNEGKVTLQVATMCSGTESPLLALQMITDALHQLHIDFKWKHLFSAEIVPFKQAYIERNFSPSIIFRDITEMLIPGAVQATTAYGGKADIPGELDLLVVGTSCVDFSAMNNNKKTLEDEGESGKTFASVLSYAEKFRPKMMVLENVSNAPWDKLTTDLTRIGYATGWRRVDTKQFYIPQTRVRGYLVAFDERLCGRAPKLAMKFKPTLESLMRPASCSLEAFLLADDDKRLIDLRKKGFKDDGVEGGKIPDWTRCQARHHVERNHVGTGNKNPLTGWVTGGALKPQDYMWRAWLSKQVDRITDTIDIAWLRDLVRGYDHRYKLRCIDLSQNVDREIDTKPAGIVGCITPTGIPFSTLRGGPIIGLESLSLQGLPIDRLTLTHESQSELQDLAGNAMTSTVVGTAILCALIIGYRDMNLGTRTHIDEDVYNPEQRLALTELQGHEKLQSQYLNLGQYDPMSVSEALKLGESGIRRCYCEGRTSVTREPLQKCDLCGHTTCVKCGVNPKHQYIPITDQNFLSGRKTPSTVEAVLKKSLPMRLKFTSINHRDLDNARKEKHLPLTQKDNGDWNIVKDYVYQAFGSELRFHSIIRSETLTARYESDVARLELVIDSLVVEWCLYAKANAREPAQSRLRRVLERPIARMRPQMGAADITLGSWDLWVSFEQQFEVGVKSGGSLIPSFENSQGLKRSTDTFMWNQLTLKTRHDDEVRQFGTQISGIYRASPMCDMAEGTLYVREGSPRQLYLFLDPHRLGIPKDDFFVLSHDKRRLNHGERRNVIAQVNSDWRPSKFELDTSDSETRRYRKDASSSLYTESELRDLDTIHLEVAGQWAELSVNFETSAEADQGEVFKIAPDNLLFNVPGPCGAATQVVLSRKAYSETSKITPFPRRSWVQIDQIDQNDFFKSNAWLMEKSKVLEGLDRWRHHPIAKVNRCQTCAPASPGILWRLEGEEEEDEKKPQPKLVPFEDVQQASNYERALKHRPSPFIIQVLMDDEDFTHVNIGLNTRTLVHRAAAILADTVGNSGIELTSRLITDYVASENANLPNFVFKDNDKDVPAPNPPGFKLELRPEQARSLSWMLKQEADDTCPFVEEEVEEASIPQLGWRAEARAYKSVIVRGGLLADEVGYGKTAITLALVDTQRNRDRERIQRSKNRRIAIKATLILVPPHLPNQWQQEVHKFIQANQGYRVIVLKSINDLRKKTISDFQNADIIIASYNMCSAETYLFELATFAGVVELPHNNSPRATTSWYANALDRLVENVEVLKTDATRLWSKVSTDLKEDARKASEVETVVPSKRLKGQAYQDAKLAENNKRKRSDEKDEKSDKKSNPMKAKDRSDNFGLRDIARGNRWTSMKCPLFELFNFSRLVIDEYTYTGNASVCIRNLSAESKWILSATPPKQDFADIKSLANLLGIYLGRTDVTAGVIKKSNINIISRDWTDSEKFHSFKSTYSQAWHEHRHAQAQAFLDQFARRNVANIGVIPEYRHLRTVVLPAAERAVYLELQHTLEALAGKDFRNFKANPGNDRERRIKQAFNGSNSPEEALLKCATHFDLETREGSPGNVFEACEDLMMQRAKEYDGLKEDISRKLKHTEWLFKWCSKSEPADYHAKYNAKLHDKIQKAVGHYTTWKGQVADNFGGDITVRKDLMDLITHAEKTYHISDWAQFYVEKLADEDKEDKKAKKSKKTKKKDDEPVLSLVPIDDRMAWDIRDETNRLRKLLKELVSRKRALRLFENTCTFLSLISETSLGSILDRELRCDICRGSVSPSTFAILTVCGHVVCYHHLGHDSGSVECEVTGCNAVVNKKQVMTAGDFAFRDGMTQTGRHYGKKIRDVVELIKKIPEEEQVLLFIQFSTLSAKITAALDDNSISYLALAEAKDSSKALTDFQNNVGKDKKKVLLLQIDDASASGSNLTNTNHVIFVSPYLAGDQQTYDAAMKQAVGRARRYGQVRPVHVYEFVSLDTVDVDTIEGRRRVELRAEAPALPTQLPFAGFEPSPFRFVPEGTRSAVGGVGGVVLG